MRVLRADPAILSAFQRRVLQLIGEAEKEYGPVQLRLMGGSALAAYYLGHRQSEDLDFFGGPALNAKDYALFVQLRFEQEGMVVRLSPDAPLNPGFARYLVAESPAPDATRVQVDFGRESAFSLEPSSLAEEGVQVASLRDLCAGKLSALCTRALPRDFIDLHAILHRPGSEGDAPAIPTVRERMRDLLRDTQQTDPGLTALVVADGLARGLHRNLATGFPLRLLWPITDADIQQTLEVAREVCAEVVREEWAQTMEEG